MVDIQLFTQSEKVEEALQRHSCKECLQWCSENKSNLKKIKVSFYKKDYLIGYLLFC